MNGARPIQAVKKFRRLLLTSWPATRSTRDFIHFYMMRNLGAHNVCNSFIDGNKTSKRALLSWINSIRGLKSSNAASISPQLHVVELSVAVLCSGLQRVAAGVITGTLGLTTTPQLGRASMPCEVLLCLYTQQHFAGFPLTVREIRRRTRVTHIAWKTDGRWLKVLEWRPRRPQTRWTDDIRRVARSRSGPWMVELPTKDHIHTKDQIHIICPAVDVDWLK
ncbi:jg23668 [Pararge aegeria aegeria]|uniref:Jg23668 protein n=1 Tax=Pararge aegeria aegeria TaxID=348720 RepID=A0A8S4QVR0_9NEOP|nr:jg23668 [Pararge aegeria aegeria]